MKKFYTAFEKSGCYKWTPKRCFWHPLSQNRRTQGFWRLFSKKGCQNQLLVSISRKWTPKLNFKSPKSNTPSLPPSFVIPLYLSGLVCDSSNLHHDLIPNLPAKDLVLGDIVELKVGDKAPADMRDLASLFPLLAGFIVVKLWFCLFSLVYSFLSI